MEQGSVAFSESGIWSKWLLVSHESLVQMQPGSPDVFFKQETNIIIT